MQDLGSHWDYFAEISFYCIVEQFWKLLKAHKAKIHERVKSARIWSGTESLYPSHEMKTS